MIVVDRRKLKFLLAGRELEVTIDRQPVKPYKRHHVYAVGITGAHGTCHAEVLAVTVSDEGVVLRIKHAPGGADQPRMLGRTTDYTTVGDPLDAGESLTAAEQELVSAEGTMRWLQERAYRESVRQGLFLHERLRELETAHSRGELDASRQLAAIRRRIEALEAKRKAA